MSEKDTIQSLLEITKKEGGLLAAFEACGRVIAEMKSDKAYLNIRIENLEKENKKLEDLVIELETELAKAKKELGKVKGGRNEW